MKKSKIMITLVAIVMATTAFAQSSSDKYPYAFFGVQGGIMKNYSGTLPDRTWAPEAGVQLGYFFHPIAGARLSATGTKWTAEVPGQADYDSKMGDISLDLLLNFSNILFPNRKNLVNVIGIAGMPWQCGAKHTYIDHYAGTIVPDYSKWNKGWKGGGMVEFDIAKHFGVNIEAGTVYMRSKVKSIEDKNRWWPYAMAGVTYKFGFKKAKKEEEPVYQPAPAPAPAPAAKKEEPKPAPAPAPVVKKEEPKPAPASAAQAKKEEPLKETIFFAIRESDPNAEGILNKVVSWCKEYPNKGITISGYADKGTGNEKVNKGYAKARAEKVAKALQDKGIAKKRMTVNSYGDTVQPFANNDDNRCVIIVGE
ncbi:MAG: OmpA family protein [Prevotella sp.]|nr:OmpA family protein [Prevotella sp.]